MCKSEVKKKLLCISHVFHSCLFGLDPRGGLSCELPSQILPSCMGIFHAAWKIPVVSYTLEMSRGRMWGVYSHLHRCTQLRASTHKELAVKNLRACLFLTGEDSPSCVYSLVFPFDLCLFPVFLIDWILALLRAGCSFPCLQLRNCIQRSLLG